MHSRTFEMKFLLSIPRAIFDSIVMLAFAAAWVAFGFAKVSRDLDRKESD